MTDVIKMAALRALNGERVVLCGHNRASAINMLNQATKHIPREHHRRYRAHGQERIETVNGGHITIMSARQPNAIRGNQITYMVLDDHRPLLNQDFTEEVLPAFEHSPRIAVIG